MGKVALCAGVLLAGSLYPILRHQPWTLLRERWAVQEVVEGHPKVKLVRLVAERGPRLRVEIQVPPDDVAKLVAFRKALKYHRVLSKHEIQAEVGWRCDRGGEPSAPIECTFLVLPPQQ